MEANKLYDIGELIQLRREIHKYAEPSFKEFKTAKRIKDYLIKKGVSEDWMTDCAIPGFYVDIRGKGQEAEKEKVIMFRAELDGLVMKEDNKDLPYVSVTEAAHMCGHDGHMVGLIGGMMKVLESLDSIPSNVCIRFLFQIAEETLSGAKKMILEGCLDNVTEAWGLHNLPIDPVDSVFLKPGTFSAGGMGVKILIKGKGGHSSLKKQLNNPVIVRSQLNVWIEESLENDFKEENEKLFTLCFPGMGSSTALNVIPDNCWMIGSLRFFNKEVVKRVYDKIEELIKKAEDKYGVEVELSPPRERLFVYNEEFLGTNPVVNNEELTKELCALIPEHTLVNEPKKFCEDFSEFADRVPSVFFGYGIGAKEGIVLHKERYDFNDACLDNIACLWMKIMKSRANK